MLVASSTNLTYLEDLRTNVYNSQNLHNCWFRGFNCDLKKRSPYSEEKFYTYLYVTIALFCSCILFWILYFCSKLCHRFRIIKINDEYESINSKSPPSYQ